MSLSPPPQKRFTCYKCGGHFPSFRFVAAHGTACVKCNYCRQKAVVDRTLTERMHRQVQELHDSLGDAAKADRSIVVKRTPTGSKRSAISLYSSSDEDEPGTASDGSVPLSSLRPRPRQKRREESSDLTDVDADDEGVCIPPTHSTPTATAAPQSQPSASAAATGEARPVRQIVRNRGKDGTFNSSSNAARKQTTHRNVSLSAFNGLKRTVSSGTSKLASLQTSVDQLKSGVKELQDFRQRMAASTHSLPRAPLALPPPPPPPSPPPPPPPTPSSTQPPELVVKRLFPWVRADIARQIGEDVLEPESLFKLRQPDRIGERETLPTVEVVLVVEDGGRKAIKVESSASAKIANFLRAVPHVTVFIQIWTVYTSIRSLYVQENAALLGGYSIFLSRIIDLAAHCEWGSMARYILAVLHERTGQSNATVWYTDSQNHFNRYVATGWTSKKTAQAIEGRSSEVNGDGLSLPNKM